MKHILELLSAYCLALCLTACGGHQHHEHDHEAHEGHNHENHAGHEHNHDAHSGHEHETAHHHESHHHAEEEHDGHHHETAGCRDTICRYLVHELPRTKTRHKNKAFSTFSTSFI